MYENEQLPEDLKMANIIPTSKKVEAKVCKK